MAPRIGGFMRRQATNFRVMLVVKPTQTFLDMLTQPYQWIYTKALGADPVQLGYVNSIGGGALSAIVAMPLGWLADRYSLKRVMIGTIALQLIVSLLYAVAWSWQMVIPAVALSTAATYLMWTISSILIAGSTAGGQRGSGFALVTFLSQISGILSPLMAGYAITTLGGISANNIRPLFYVQVIGYVLLPVYAYRRLQEQPPPRSMRQERGFVDDFREIFRGRGDLRRFILLRCLMSFINSLVGPFVMVFAMEMKGMNALDIGAMTTVGMVVAILVAIPLGRFSDSFGRRQLIFIQELCTSGQYLLLILAPPSKPEYLIVAWAIGGVQMGGTGWTTMIMEMVPPDQRGRWGGISNFFNGISMIPASILGGLLWMTLNPQLPFIVFIVLDLLISMPLLASIPETLRHAD